MFNTARSRNASDCCESILVTTALRGRKSKPPPSHKTRGWGTRTSTPKTLAPELQHPKSQHLNFNTRTSTPKTSTPELQHPKSRHSNFKTRNSKSQGRLSRVTGCRARHVLHGLNLSTYPQGHAVRIRLTHWAGWVHT